MAGKWLLASLVISLATSGLGEVYGDRRSAHDERQEFIGTVASRVTAAVATNEILAFNNSGAAYLRTRCEDTLLPGAASGDIDVGERAAIERVCAETRTGEIVEEQTLSQALRTVEAELLADAAVAEAKFESETVAIEVERLRSVLVALRRLLSSNCEDRRQAVLDDVRPLLPSVSDAQADLLIRSVVHRSETRCDVDLVDGFGDAFEAISGGVLDRLTPFATAVRESEVRSLNENYASALRSSLWDPLVLAGVLTGLALLVYAARVERREQPEKPLTVRLVDDRGHDE